MTMPKKSIEVCATGKWILAGEHAVLRGCSALAFPVKSQYFKITYTPFEGPLEVQATPGLKIDYTNTFNSAFDRALSSVSRKKENLSGHLSIDANISLGAGVGGSASICAAIGRLFEKLGWVDKDHLFNFCRNLEDVFHGQSSGLDVAVVLSGHGIEFNRSGEFHKIICNWQPNWYLSHSGLYGKTSECIKKVKNLIEQDKALGASIDEDMKISVKTSLEALESNKEEGLKLLVKAIRRANSCFERWKLIPDEMQRQMDDLVAAGAIATKPTGAGGGGYILSLWPDDLNQIKLPKNLLSIK